MPALALLSAVFRFKTIAETASVAVLVFVLAGCFAVVCFVGATFVVAAAVVC